MSPSFVQSISSLLNFSSFCGDWKRSSFTGGFAKGIPENLKNDLPSGSFSWQPRTVPWLTLTRTFGSVNDSESVTARLTRVVSNLIIISRDIFLRTLHGFSHNLSAANLQLIDVDRKVLPTEQQHLYLEWIFNLVESAGFNAASKYSKCSFFVHTCEKIDISELGFLHKSKVSGVEASWYFFISMSLQAMRCFSLHILRTHYALELFRQRTLNTYINGALIKVS